MQNLRPIFIALLFIAQSAATAAAGEVHGEGRLITQRESQDVIDRYRNIPGGGVVTGEGRLIGSGEAADITRRYRSIPGRGVVIGEGRLITTEEASTILKRYKSVPGGLVLEGTALGMEWVRAAQYEPSSHAFVLNGDIAYHVPISARGVATLARAIAGDDRIGVSLGEEVQITYGKLRSRSDVAADLRLADGFLGDLVLPPRDWTIGYRLAEAFAPREDVVSTNVTVLFRLKDFRFATEDKQLKFERASLDVRVVPVLEKYAADGGYLPDLKAIARGSGFEAYEANARHVGANVAYYLREQIVARALDYAETAAFLRALKASGINLRNLVRGVEASSDRPTAGKLDDDWRAYLSEIQAANAYGNWSAPPYDLYSARKRIAPAQQQSRLACPAQRVQQANCN
ncbi:MAG: hypothetical protein F9K29_11085 [Hyphomicrobiaceae bacterium]|nr:MAG: hypothetical protein F9K29_11085 [Hyphomicrobiaceae bacterium]